jgi:type III restriction enzyme
MTFDLYDYQAEVVDKLAYTLDQARAGYDNIGAYTAVGLVAPTASGKTVIAAALLERLFDTNPDLCVIWLSDQPSLNAQSKNKIELACPALNHARLLSLADLDQRALEPGKIYFAHNQQFYRGSTSYHAAIIEKDGARSSNDERTFGVWDMVAHTVEDGGSNVLLVVDEAHRGVGNESNTNLEGKTILSTLIHGGPRNVGGDQPPMPVVLGISATIDKFTESMRRAGGSSIRTTVPIAADIAKVRASGLLKDHIDIPAPVEDQEADQTLIAEAVKIFKEVTGRWSTYHAETGAGLVEPVMVVQVKPAISNPDLAIILSTLEKSWAVLKTEAIGHAFDSHTDLAVGSGASKRTIRYIAPEAITDDDRVKVVLFKTALTTGWDCPRAEVMVSLRGSGDPTTIAQLIGRMVRTPLARRIDDGDEELNTVFLSLPYYDDTEVAKVVVALTDDADVKQSLKIFTVPTYPNPNVTKNAFDLLGKISSASRPAPAFKTTTARAIELAGELSKSPFNASADADLETRLTQTLATEYAVHKDAVDEKAHDAMHLDTKDTRFSGQGDAYVKTSETAVRSTALMESDMNKAYKKACAALPGGVGESYFRHITLKQEDLSEMEAQGRVIAMSRMSSVVAAVEKAAADQILGWENAYKTTWSNLANNERKETIQAFWNPVGVTMTDTHVEVPQKISAATQKVEKDDAGVPHLVPLPLVHKHLFSVENTDDFPIKHGSTWEEDVLQKVLADQTGTLKSWYRNPSSGKNALAVQYEQAGEQYLLHPDFLFFYEGENGLVVDIVDPHQHSNADTGPKWRALAGYAAKVGTGEGKDWLRNVRGVIKGNSPTGHEVLRWIDLRDETTVKVLEGANNKADIEAIFADHGYDY